MISKCHHVASILLCWQDSCVKQGDQGNTDLVSGGASVFAARSKRLCCRPTPAVRSPIDILMVTTMALVWTVLSWGCNYVMQWNLGYQLQLPKRKLPIRQKRPNFRIPYFCTSKCRPIHSAARGECPLPSLPAATGPGYWFLIRVHQ